MEAINISGLNFHQHEELRTRAEHRVTEMRETGAPALREQWAQEPSAIGMTIEEVMQTGDPDREPEDPEEHFAADQSACQPRIVVPMYETQKRLNNPTTTPLYFFHMAPSTKPMAAATANITIGCSFICFST